MFGVRTALVPTPDVVLFQRMDPACSLALVQLFIPWKRVVMAGVTVAKAAHIFSPLFLIYKFQALSCIHRLPGLHRQQNPESFPC